MNTTQEITPQSFDRQAGQMSLIWRYLSDTNISNFQTVLLAAGILALVGMWFDPDWLPAFASNTYTFLCVTCSVAYWMCKFFRTYFHSTLVQCRVIEMSNAPQMYTQGNKTFINRGIYMLHVEGNTRAGKKTRRWVETSRSNFDRTQVGNVIAKVGSRRVY